MEFPQDLKYAKTHEWIRVDGDKAKLGITDFAQSELGDIVYVEPPGIGDEFAAGDEIAMIDSAKTSAQIYTPVDCTVIAVNDLLMEKPELVNTDPFGEGHLFEIEIKDPTQLDDLMDATVYAEYTETGGGH